MDFDPFYKDKKKMVRLKEIGVNIKPLNEKKKSESIKIV